MKVLDDLQCIAESSKKWIYCPFQMRKPALDKIRQAQKDPKNESK